MRSFRRSKGRPSAASAQKSSIVGSSTFAASATGSLLRGGDALLGEPRARALDARREISVREFTLTSDNRRGAPEPR